MLGAIMLVLLLFFFIGVALYLVSIYNGLIRLSNNIAKAWANIDVLLKQRYDELPKLIKVCEGYMKHERETLEKLTAARTACLQASGVNQTAQAENQLAGVLKTLFAVAENYPDLKANQNFMQLQQRISYLESQIADRREFYNDSVNLYNIRIHQIPDMWVAQSMGLSSKEMFKVDEAQKQDVEIKFDFHK